MRKKLSVVSYCGVCYEIVLWRIGRVLGASWGVLSATCVRLGASWVHVGRLLEFVDWVLERVRDVMGALWLNLVGYLGRVYENHEE